MGDYYFNYYDDCPDSAEESSLDGKSTPIYNDLVHFQKYKPYSVFYSHFRQLNIDSLRYCFQKTPEHFHDYSLDDQRNVQLGRHNFKYFVYGSAREVYKPSVEFNLNIGYNTFNSRPLDEGLTSICNYLVQYYAWYPRVSLKLVSFFLHSISCCRSCPGFFDFQSKQIVKF